MKKYLVCILTLGALALNGCGKDDDKKKEPANADAKPGSVAKDALGTWFMGDDAMLKVTKTFNANGTTKTTVAMQGTNILDAEAVVSFDEKATPKRFIETITKITSSAETDLEEGSVGKCIYELVTPKQVKIECGDDYPKSFSDEAELYNKQ